MRLGVIENAHHEVTISACVHTDINIEKSPAGASKAPPVHSLHSPPPPSHSTRVDRGHRGCLWRSLLRFLSAPDELLPWPSTRARASPNLRLRPPRSNPNGSSFFSGLQGHEHWAAWVCVRTQSVRVHGARKLAALDRNDVFF
jgi:hypothetical protein